MMIGRDESMPYAVPERTAPPLAAVTREPDLDSDDRNAAIDAANEILRTLASLSPSSPVVGLDVGTAVVLARAVVRYCPPGVPVAAPLFIAPAGEPTMPSQGVVIAVVDRESSGVPEPSGDDHRTTQFNAGQTGMFDVSGVDLASVDPLDLTNR